MNRPSVYPASSLPKSITRWAAPIKPEYCISAAFEFLESKSIQECGFWFAPPGLDGIAAKWKALNERS